MLRLARAQASAGLGWHKARPGVPSDDPEMTGGLKE